MCSGTDTRSCWSIDYAWCSQACARWASSALPREIGGVRQRIPTWEMPGTLVVEALAQTSAAVLIGLLNESAGAVGYFAAADRVRFRSLPRVGDTLFLTVELVWYRRGVARLRGAASVDGRLAVSANFTTVVRSRVA